MTSTQISRALKTLTLVSVLGLSVAGLSQCRMVDNTITGVNLNAPGSVKDRADCEKRCNEEKKEDRKAEEARHAAAQRSCNGNKACKDAEEALHKRLHHEEEQDAKDCKRGCYNEGAGNGGR